MRSRHREQEGFFEQEFHVQLVVVHRQREHARIEPAFAQLREQDDVGLFLDQQQFESREARADARHDVRQQVGPERREQAQAHACRLRDRGVRRAASRICSTSASDAARALGDVAARPA